MTRCYLKQFHDSPCDFRADGQPDRCHLVPQQRLRNAGIGEAAKDSRSWVLGCRHHHHLLDNHVISLSLRDYPEAFIIFATEHGLYWNADHKQWRVGFREAA